MASHSKSRLSRTKVAAHRARLRAQGLRSIQIWVPNVRSPEFKAEAVRLMNQGDLSVSEVGRDLGINPSLLGKWKQPAGQVEAPGGDRTAGSRIWAQRLRYLSRSRAFS